MWIDTTCFNPYEIPVEAKQMVFCSPHDNIKQKHIKNNYSYFCDSGGWRSWNLGTCMKHNSIFMFCRDLIQALAIKEKCLPNYFMVDLIMCYAYRKIPQIRQMIESVPDNNIRWDKLHFTLNKPWNREEYELMTKDNWVFKLSYKTIWKERYNGQPTFYAKLMKDKTAK